MSGYDDICVDWTRQTLNQKTPELDKLIREFAQALLCDYVQVGRSGTALVLRLYGRWMDDGNPKRG